LFIFRVINTHPCFITIYNVFKEIFICFYTFKQIRGSSAPSSVLSAAVCGMDFAGTSLKHKSLVKIAWHEPKEIPSSTAASLLVNLQSALTKSHLFHITCPFLLNEGYTECSFLSGDVCPSLKQWKHSTPCIKLMASSQNNNNNKKQF
jgi:hypothetical protein